MKYDIKDKIITVEKALQLVKNDDHIFTGLGASEGRDFLSQLHTLHGKVKNVTVTNCLPMQDYEFYMNPAYKSSFKLAGWFYNAGMRKAHAHGSVTFIPNVLHYAGTKRLEHVKPNIYIGIATYPDEHGFVSLSLGNTYEKQVIKESDIVILEINPNAPRTYGDLELHVRDVDYFIEVNYPIPEIPNVEPNEKDLIIGKYISELINDGDCLQLGIGSP